MARVIGVEIIGKDGLPAFMERNDAENLKDSLRGLLFDLLGNGFVLEHGSRGRGWITCEQKAYLVHTVFKMEAMKQIVEVR